MVKLESDTVLIVPTYNEEDHIEDFLRGCPPEWDIIVVDASTDSTPDKVRKAFRNHLGGRRDLVTTTWLTLPRDTTSFFQTQYQVTRYCAAHRRCILMQAQKRVGLGPDTVAAIRMMFWNRYKYMVYMDVGSQSFTDAKQLRRMAQLHREEATDVDGRRVVVLGSRFVPGTVVVNHTVFRRILSYLAGTVVRTLLGIRSTDPTHGFKCWSREALDDIAFGGQLIDDIAYCRDGYCFQFGMAYLVDSRNISRYELPIWFSGTKTNLKPSMAITALRQLFNLRRHKKNVKD